MPGRPWSAWAARGRAGAGAGRGLPRLGTQEQCRVHRVQGGRAAVEEGGSRRCRCTCAMRRPRWRAAEGHGADYRYAHDEPDAFAAGENYLPEHCAMRASTRPRARSGGENPSAAGGAARATMQRRRQCGAIPDAPLNARITKALQSALFADCGPCIICCSSLLAAPVARLRATGCRPMCAACGLAPGPWGHCW
jgi:hypothetical protein